MITSLYIHIPFCKKICSYCAFCKVYYNTVWVNKYLDALEYEIKNKYNGETLKTIYIGGGTPSSLKKEELKKLFKILESLNLKKEYEFTFECNINDINETLLGILKDNNVNRLSIGIESFNQKKLNFLNRDITFADAKNKIKLCKEKGFNNINVDLIYAVLNETITDLKNDLDDFLKLDVQHISTYSLMIEKNTMIKDLHEIDQEKDYQMYKTICDTLEKKGYNHYEISNFAKKGFESKHNLVYWHNEKYYGFGLGASGYTENRYTNTRNFTEYLKHNYLYEEEMINKKLDVTYGLILGLRLTNGINVNDFNKKYKLDLLDYKNVKDLIKEKLLDYTNGYLKIPKDKLYIENEILTKLI